jgi:hypothetical protein
MWFNSPTGLVSERGILVAHVFHLKIAAHTPDWLKRGKRSKSKSNQTFAVFISHWSMTINEQLINNSQRSASGSFIQMNPH